jgi:hypothetical protein
VENANRFFAVVICIVSVIILFAGPISAKSSNKIQGTIIFDFAGEKGDSPKAYVFGGKTIDTIITKLGLKVENVIGGSKDREAFLRKLKKKYRQGTGNRWISKEEDRLEVFAFYKKPKTKPGKKNAEKADKKKEDPKPKIEFAEKSRKTRIAQDLSILVKTVVAIAAKGKKPEIEIYRTTYQLTKRRAILTVTASLSGAKTSKVEVVTGPSEHWFLSTDLPVVRLSNVKFVQAKGTLEPKETPKNIYLGLNCMIGDILKERQGLLKNFFVKGMLKFSKKPLDGYGVGIGYRFPKVRPLGIDISSFSVFAAMMWTKEENDAKTETLTKRQILFGVSYNLDKALGWVK